MAEFEKKGYRKAMFGVWSKCPFNDVTNHGRVWRKRYRKVRLGGQGLLEEARKARLGVWSDLLTDVTSYGRGGRKGGRKKRLGVCSAPFNGVTSYGRVHRKGAGKRGVECALTAAPMAQAPMTCLQTSSSGGFPSACPGPLYSGTCVSASV